MQDRPVFFVCKRDVTESHGAGRTHEWLGVGSLSDIRRFVKQSKGPLGAGEMGLHRGHFFADGLQRAVKLCQIAHHQEQIAQRQRSRLDIVYSDEKDSRHSRCGDQRHQETEAAFGESQTDAGPHALVRFSDEALLFTVLLAECLHHAGRSQHLVHHRQGGTFQLFHLARLAAKATAIGSRDQKDQG